jgi:hypothetical protein
VTSPPFVRRLTFARRDDGSVVGALEDHVHHFEVTVRVTSDGTRVGAIGGRAVRAPWSLCPGATALLDELVGAPVGIAPRVADPTEHCTHLLDLATIAVRFAGLDLPTRRYRAVVDGWDGPVSRGRVERDDGAELAWEVAGRTITAPDRFAGVTIGGGFSAWAAEHLDADTAEMAHVLRRATWMGIVRGIDLDAFDRLSDMVLPPGSCYSSQPDRIDLALRNRGSSLEALDR